MSKQKTVGIIGGGVSGLAAGSLLSRRGLRVKLFEANEKLGGCCANTRWGGYTFNDGALYLGFPGILDHVFERLGLNRPAVLPWRKITSQQTLLPDGTRISIEAGPRITVEKKTGAVDPVRPQRELRAALAKWEPVLRIFEQDLFTHPFSPSRFMLKLWPHLHKLQGTVASELRSLYSDRAIRAALSGMLLFTGWPPQKTPVPLILGLVSVLSDGFHLPEGGMGKIPDALGRSLRNNGGAIMLQAPVRKILLSNKRLKGIELENREMVELDAVISTVGGLSTFGLCLHSEDWPRGFARKWGKAPGGHKTLALQLGLSNRIDGCGFSNGIMPMMNHQSEYFRPEGEEAGWLVFFVPTVSLPELSPEGGSIVEMFPAIPQHIPSDDWDEGKTGRVVDSALQRFSRLHKIDLAVKRVLSPKDFQNRLHLNRGAIYGWSPPGDFRTLFPHASPIPGLYQAGQTTYPGFGVGPAAMSGILAAETLLERETW